MKAFYRGRVTVFNPHLKDRHWGKRKLKRDERRQIPQPTVPLLPGNILLVWTENRLGQMAKEKRTAAHLEAMILDEIRKHPDLRIIQAVAVTPHRRKLPHGPTWEAAYVTEGSSSKAGMADEILRKLQDQFDLL